MTGDGRTVAKASKDAPNNDQPMTVLMAKHPEGMSGPDTMIQAEGSKVEKSAGEAAVKKYRTMY